MRSHAAEQIRGMFLRRASRQSIFSLSADTEKASLLFTTETLVILKLLLVLLIAGIAQTARAQETRRLRFAVTNPPHFLPIWLAKDAGILLSTDWMWK